jgi:hypothetical protein
MVQAPPPGPVGEAFASNRCARCHWALYDTEATGLPQRSDHEPGCEFFDRAIQIMRYANALQAAAGGLNGRGLFSSDRQRQRYWLKNSRALSNAACTGNPVLAVARLREKYAAECRRGTKQSKEAEMLMNACLALTQGKNPRPL